MNYYFLASLVTFTTLLTQNIEISAKMTLREIAQKTGTTTRELEDLNPSKTLETRYPKNIRIPNQHIHVVQNGETLAHILKRYSLPYSKFQQYNPHIKYVTPKQWIALSPKGVALTFKPRMFQPNEMPDAISHNANELKKPHTMRPPKASSHTSKNQINLSFHSENNHTQKRMQPREALSPYTPLIMPSSQLHPLPNLYTSGQCTAYAFQRRYDIGKPINNGWGDAKNWRTAAEREGFRVNAMPEVGAVLVSEEGMYGHVALVEAVKPTHILVSEMNWIAPYVVSQRVIENFQQYTYIH
ncbi:COG3942 and LysM peptidoglycan-binding domain-containing protein [Staphylococcus ratti]|uniref:CHAP domain-containing protein n=1 Tax=Staphylococcus ratti TaxID=2892440 RepID=A0ABY3PBU7_9STAP|nr:CHAP domain-containing protein [Staphylococcus ratti]UEX89743.1 CHAP domain-containing protein [Staphylococcus ratti]